MSELRDIAVANARAEFAPESGRAKCAATTLAGKPCQRYALPFTINGTCRMHHNAVRRWSAKVGWREKDSPYGVRDTWGSPLAGS